MEKKEEDIITKILAKIDKDGSIPDLLAFAKYVTVTPLMTTKKKHKHTFKFISLLWIYFILFFIYFCDLCSNDADFYKNKVMPAITSLAAKEMVLTSAVPKNGHSITAEGQVYIILWDVLVVHH